MRRAGRILRRWRRRLSRRACEGVACGLGGGADGIGGVGGGKWWTEVSSGLLGTEFLVF